MEIFINYSKSSPAFVMKTKEKEAPNNLNISFKGRPQGKFTNISNFEVIFKAFLKNTDEYDLIKKKLPKEFFNIDCKNNTCNFQKARPLIDTLCFPFVKLPKEILNFTAEKFEINSLKNSKLLIDFNQEKEFEKAKQAIRGLLNTADNTIKGYCKKNNIKEKDLARFLNKNCENKKDLQKTFTEVIEDLQKEFNRNLAIDTAAYNTAHERTIVRLVSGFSAAAILGNDFYNKSVKNGKTQEEALDEMKSKRKQEIIENTQEALAQYIVLGAFSSFTNNHQYAAPLINTALCFFFGLSSRLLSKRPIRRIKPQAQLKYSAPAMQEFISGKRDVEVNAKKPAQNKSKKHPLSPKNIALACIASIIAGFGFRKLKTASIFDALKDYRKTAIGEVLLDKNEFCEFIEALENSGFEKAAEAYKKSKLSEALKEGNGRKIFIGEFEKMTNTKIQISTKELLTLPFTPLKIAKEFIFYPYKIVSKALEGLNLIEKEALKEYKDEFGFVNTILDYRKQKAKFNNDVKNKEFLEYYKKHLENSRITALNKETKSKVNNCDIGKLTALFGIFSSLYFAGNDDYNSTFSQTGDVNKAKKDARLRMINKIIRTSVQCVFLNLNNLFKTSYKTSLMAAGIITACCTISTDFVTRVLSGMPFKKMNKKELEEYGSNKKAGILKNYYKFLDKLTD